MKIAVLYTTKSDALVKALEKNARNLFGKNVELLELQDESILKDIAAAKRVDNIASAKYMNLINRAIMAQADAILNTCLQMDDFIVSLRGFAEFTGVPILSLSTELIRRALSEQKKLTLLVMTKPAMDVVRRDVDRLIRSTGFVPHIQIAVADGVKSGLKGARLGNAFAELLKNCTDEAGCVLLCQPSMASAAQKLSDSLGCIVHTPLEHPLDGLYRALVETGKVK